ncbi:DUF4124 domain-containing protein [Ramlibacter tataouinensis]|nr:DUF4124 domain-containing protein [Ramlibacter tataouinensis]
MNLFRSLLLGLACAAPAIGLAQWQWVDKDGRKVFSDQSPPPEIPAKNILKQPGGRALVPAAAEPVPTAAPAPSAVPASAATRTATGTLKIGGKDKELEEKKKQAEAAEAEKRKAEEERVAKARADNCSRAKQSKADFDSGMRIARTNAKGEREVLDDAQRAAEVKRLQEMIASECKAS